MIETFKIIKGYDIVRPNGVFLDLDDNHQRTRGHNMKLIKPRHRTHKRNNFFSARVVDKWNNLPESVVNSDNINMFKRRYDRYMSNK